jgi:uncharacterized protein YajQ (UPF0234 family)
VPGGIHVAKDASFDIVSEVSLTEVGNAIQQARKEVETRFDFKGSKSEIQWDDESITLISDDEFKLTQLLDVLRSKLVKREVPLQALKPGKVEPAAGGTVRQVFQLQQGIDADIAKKITKLIRDSKIKVQAQIQGDQVRVSGKSRDDLQSVMSLLRAEELPIALQFVNYRS